MDKMVSHSQNRQHLLAVIEDIYTKSTEWVDLDKIPELDLSQIFHGCSDLAEIKWRDVMNLDPPNHWVLFLSCDLGIEILWTTSLQ